MKTVEDIIGSLAPKKYAIFVSGDPGVITMQEELKRLKLQMWQEGKIEQREYENANGVFLRFSVDGVIYSGIIQTRDQTETRGMLLRTPPELHEKGASLLTILKIPLDRIPLFPFFTALDKSVTRELRQKLSTQYWASFSNDVEALKSWYLDFVKSRRKIINIEVPQLEPAVPSWIGNLKVYVLYNEKDRIIATRYYRSSEKIDDVLIEKTPESFGLRESEKAFSSLFTLPEKQNSIFETTQFSKEGEKVYSNWDHPFFRAADEVREYIEKFNRAQPRILFDAYHITRARIYNWTYQEISKTRQLASKFSPLTEAFQHWLEPIQVLIFYFIDQPVKGRITDGIITAYYVNGPQDEIVVEKVESRDDAKWNEDLVQKYFPASKRKPIWGFTSLMFAYLGKKLGADY